MAGPTHSQVLAALKSVTDPAHGRDVVSLGMVRELKIEDEQVQVNVELPAADHPSRHQIRSQAEQAIRAVPGVQTVEVTLTAKARTAAAEDALDLPKVRDIIAVGAGKGGVGKSTLAVLTAVGLARSGARVGLLDADIYGPSIPKMLGIEHEQPYADGDRILPVEAAGVKVISMGLLLEPGKPVIWRGPMIHQALQQFLGHVVWGELDYLVVDLPPGTGDVPLSLAQSIPITGAVVVCTPQEVALADAVRALRMYQQMGISVLGIVENMSYFVCPNCDSRHEIFGHGGARQAAADLHVPFLGAILINIGIRAAGDAGEPLNAYERSDPATREAVQQYIETLTSRIAERNRTEPPPAALRTRSDAGCGH